MVEKIKTCIILLSWNEKKLTINCLNSIKKNTQGNYKIIIVDNGSQDGSQKIIRERFPEIDLIKLKENHGFSGGNNIGIKYARKKYNPSYYYFLNNDTLVTKRWLKNILDFADTKSDGGMFGSRQRDFKNKEAIYAGYMSRIGLHKYISPEKPKEVTWIPGGSFLVKKEVIKKVGGFDTLFNPLYYEESDWQERARKEGFKIYTVPDSFIYHKGSGTIESYTFSSKKVFYEKRFIFYMRYYKKFIIIRIIFDILRGFQQRNLKIVIAGYLEGFKKILKIHKVETIFIK